jgi:hypothetical protein
MADENAAFAQGGGGMTDHFETLIYTDCRPGQGLRGGPGLQFQAKSAGIRAVDMDVVAQALLYEAPTGWINERRPVEDYPPSLGHVWDRANDVLATAQGTYLGREVNAMREGNQITHAIATTDPDGYGLVRPAQLLNAQFWATEVAPSTQCRPLEAGWQPGPCGPETIRDFVAAQADGRGLLVTLLAALDRLGEPNAARVLFVADRPEQVIKWIAAATLLLPQRRALAVGFKVFTTNPSYCPLPVLAVHPDWAGPYRSVDASSGFVVLDLVTRRHTPIEVDEQAELWADLFLDVDPYDVMDAVELADTIERAGGTRAQGRAIAIAGMFGRAPRPRDVPAVAAWVARGDANLVHDHGEAAVHAVLGIAAGENLRLLDEAAAAGRVSAAAASIRMALLRDELASAARTGDAIHDKLPRLPRTGPAAPDRAACAAWAATALAAIESAPDQSIDAVLRVAWRHSLDLPISGFVDRATRFAAWWADHPELPYDPGRWPCGPEMIDALRDELTGRLRGQPEAARETVRAVRRHWWRLLLETSRDPFHPLDTEVMVGVMNTADPATCERFVKTSVNYATGLHDVTDAVSQVCINLWFTRAPTVPEALTALRIIPADVPVEPKLIDTLAEAFDAAWPLSDAAGLDAAALLSARGVETPDPWRTWHSQDQRLRNICAALPTAIRGQQQDQLKNLCALSEEVLTARVGRISVALAQHEGTSFVVMVLAGLPKRVALALLNALVRDRSLPPHLATAREFTVLANKHLPKRLKETLADDLRRRLAKDDAHLAEDVGIVLARESPALRKAWITWAANGVRDLP